MLTNLLHDSQRKHNSCGLQRPHCCLLWELYETHKHHVSELQSSLMLRHVVCNWRIKNQLDATYYFIVPSKLGSRTPRFMNNSVYEQISRTQSVSDDVLCLELRTRELSTSWSDKLGVSAYQVQWVWNRVEWSQGTEKKKKISPSKQ